MIQNLLSPSLEDEEVYGSVAPASSEKKATTGGHKPVRRRKAGNDHVSNKDKWEMRFEDLKKFKVRIGLRGYFSTLLEQGLKRSLHFETIFSLNCRSISSGGTWSLRCADGISCQQVARRVGEVSTEVVQALASDWH